jgi:hypothetical protein
MTYLEFGRGVQDWDYHISRRLPSFIICNTYRLILNPGGFYLEEECLSFD